MSGGRGVPISLVIAHRSAFIRDVLRRKGSYRDVATVGEAESGAQLVELCEAQRPAVVCVDTELQDGPVEGVLRAVLATGAKVLVISDDLSPERLTHLLARGASGHLLQDASPDQVIDAIEAVAAGQCVLGPLAATVVVEQWRRLRDPGESTAPRDALTPREHDVLAAMADGLVVKAIGKRLGISVKTVEAHKVRIFAKLGARSQAHAVGVAIAHGLVKPGAAFQPAAHLPAGGPAFEPS
jgi:DNA-binding NarL/FixJ family response regulator